MKHHITYVDEGYGYESASCSCGEKWGSMGGGMLAAETALHKCDAEAAELTGLRAEVERLRGMLAEARTYLKQPVKGEVRERWRSTLYGDIDAALAEPSGKLKAELCDVAELQKAAAVEAFHDATRLRSQIQQARINAENERDEARAEVEQLRRDWAATQNALNQATYERDEARATVAALEEGIAAQDEVLTNRYNAQLKRAQEALQLLKEVSQYVTPMQDKHAPILTRIYALLEKK